MHKSNIPFFFANSSLNNVFLESSSSKNLAKVLNFQLINIEGIKDKRYKIFLTDSSTLKKISQQNIKINKVFIIDEINITETDTKIDAEVIKINIPFKMNDLCQRIENNLIQVNANRKRLIKYKRFTYDPTTRELSSKLFALRFTEKESQIFICLIENSEAYISKKDLLRKVWSYGEEIDTHTLETHVYALRRKIEIKLKIKDLIMFQEKKGYYLNKSIL
jgi:DNA-binding winged helix-turn-helix (wHTH) protein